MIAGGPPYLQHAENGSHAGIGSRSPSTLQITAEATKRRRERFPRQSAKMFRRKITDPRGEQCITKNFQEKLHIDHEIAFRSLRFQHNARIVRTNGTRNSKCMRNTNHKKNPGKHPPACAKAKQSCLRLGACSRGFPYQTFKKRGGQSRRWRVCFNH